jgi:hypothetical protein
VKWKIRSVERSSYKQSYTTRKKITKKHNLKVEALIHPLDQNVGEDKSRRYATGE